jgi:hypothetical protein
LFPKKKAAELSLRRFHIRPVPEADLSRTT